MISNWMLENAISLVWGWILNGDTDPSVTKIIWKLHNFDKISFAIVATYKYTTLETADLFSQHAKTF